MKTRAIALLTILAGVVSWAAFAQDDTTDGPPPAVVTDADLSSEWPEQSERYTCAPGEEDSRALIQQLREFSKSQREKAASLDDRARAIESLKAELAEESARLEAAIVEIKTQREAAQREADARARQKADRERPAKEAKLAKMLGKMDAQSASLLLQRLEGTLAASLLQKMSPGKAGAALAAMEPARAARLAALSLVPPEKKDKSP